MSSKSSNDIINVIRSFTMTSNERIENLLNLVKDVDSKNVEGSLVECGVWKCGMLGLMSLASASNRKVFGFDSFEGLPEPKEEDGMNANGWGGTLRVSLEEASENLKTMGANVTLIKGFFDETISEQKHQLGKIAILRLDGDWYDSTTTCLNELYDLVSPGGYIIIDDYGHWEGCQKATDDFRSKRGITSPLNQTDYTEMWWQK